MSNEGRMIEYRDYPVLIVDDEPENLRIFQIAFRRELSVITAKTGREALEVLGSRRVAVILSDHRMPEMSGVDLLARVREFVPEVVRVLVTAYGDASTLARAINDGAIYRYVAKPWNVEEMRSTVRQAIERFVLEAERLRLGERLEAIIGLARELLKHESASGIADELGRALVDDLQFDCGALLLWDATGTRLEQAGLTRCGVPKEYELDEATELELFAALRKGDAQMCGRAGPRRELSRVRAEPHGDVALMVPVVAGGGMLGAIVVENHCGGQRLGRSDVTLLEGIAAQVASRLAMLR